MTLRYLYVIDPIHTLNPLTDSTYYLMLESQARGVDNLICQIDDLIISDGGGFARSTQIRVRIPTAGSLSFYELGQTQTMGFDDFDVIWMRKDPPVDDNFLAATMILDCHNPAYTILVNNPRSLRVANEKLWGLSVMPGAMPKTVVSSRPNVLYDAVQHFGQGVLKPLFGSGGAGVLMFDKNDRNLRSALELHTNNGRRPALVQEYLTGARHGDKRVIVLGGKAIGAMLRVPQEQDHRANLHVGGSAQKAKVSLQEENMIKQLGPLLVERGLHFVGLDIIDGKITEINVTSPTCLQEIDLLDERKGKNKLNCQIMDYIDRLLLERS